jgi:hypothetical protein
VTRSTIYTVDASGNLTSMRPSEPRSEDFMQSLVAMHPEIIADQDGALLLIRREQPIADCEEGGGRWSLDHLFVTRSGIPVLVELKRAVDTRLRREVIGQMLDYAANGTAFWQSGRIAEAFVASMGEMGRDADQELAAFLGGAADPQQFWEQVDANFAAGRIKMVFVADTIPRELARIVEFLNEQMRADVRAVELTWFESEGGVTALAPRLIGETERALTEKSARATLPPISEDAWIEQYLAKFGQATVDAAQAYIRLVGEAGGQADVPPTQGSIVAAFNVAGDTIYPLALSRYGKGSVQLCLSYLVSRPAFASLEARQDLYDRLVSIVGPLSTKTLNGFPAFPATRLNDRGVRDDIRDFLIHIVEQMGATE